MHIQQLELSLGGTPRVSATLAQKSAVLFQPDIQIQLLPQQGDDVLYARDFSAAAYPVAWLPRGEYHLQCHLHDLNLPAGEYRLRLIVFAVVGGQRQALNESGFMFSNPSRHQAAGLSQPAWSLQSAPGTFAIEELGWNRGHEDWFFRHFDHAALVVTDYLLKGHPMLKGRILDVGCGDGIIDLGIFLRLQPQELVGIDPFKGYERLPDVLSANHLPPDVLDDSRLKFRDEDANDIPYPDDYFDVVVSWGSLEHIAGGYGQALQEIRRVLKPGGLFFVHPGLYFGALGNHLGEFFEDPFMHLKLPEAELKEAVLKARPERMDRAGHVATPEEYWQWYTELNPIRVGEFEQELRGLGFEPWRVALRTSDIIEYTAELQGHAMQDLATAELYLSAWNRK
jgi:SAM-dependent methyltransferase